MRNTLVLAIAALGCGGGTKQTTTPSEGSGSASTAPAATGLTGDCRTDATAVGKFLADTPHDGGSFMRQHGVELVKRDDVPIAPTPVAPVVIANPEEITFQGQLVDRAALEEQLRFHHARIVDRPALAGVIPNRIYLHLDARTPWSKVVQIVQAAEAAGFTEPAFLFDIGFKLTRPPRSAVDDQLDVLLRSDDASNKATSLAEITRGVIQSCPAMITLFGAVASAEGSRAQFLIDGVAPALIECNCSADLPSIRSLLFTVLAVAPTVQVIAFDASRGTTLELPGATTWAEASKRFKVGTRGMKLIAK